MEASTPSKGIFDSANLEARESVVELLRKAYWMEIETVMSYISASVNLDGVRAQEVKESLGTTSKRSWDTRAASPIGSRSSTGSSPARRTSRPSSPSCSRRRSRPTSST